MLTGGLVLSGPLAALADGEDQGTDPATGSTGAASEPVDPAGDQGGADGGQGDQGTVDQGQGAGTDGSGDATTPSSGGTGFSHGGTPAGPATFAPLPADPAYPVPEPLENKNLPEQVDEDTGYQDQLSCDPHDRPGVTAFAMLLSEHYGREAWSGARACIDYMSQHHDGRALDWNLDANDPQDRRIGDAAVAWLTENDGEMMRRFGIEYIIWNGLVFMKDDNEWRHYVGESPHTDHVHFTFTWDGATMRTSWWTGVAVTQPDLGPCAVVSDQYAAVHTFPRFEACSDPAVAAPSSELAAVRPGGSGPGVSMLQTVLGLDPTGVLDDATGAALIEWQTEHDVPATGVADALTYAAAQGLEVEDLPASAQAVVPEDWQVSVFTPYKRTTLTQGDTGKAVVAVQEALGAEPDGDFGPKTAEALAEFEESIPVLAEQARRRGDEPAAITPLTWVFLERAVHPTMALRDLELAEGSRDVEGDPEGELAAEAATSGRADSPYAGGAVAVLQELVGVEADGSYGPITAKAVAEVQEAAGLEPTGAVDGPTWVAVEEVAIDEERVAGPPGLEAQRAREAKAREREEKEQEKKEQAAKEAKAKADAEAQAAKERHEAAVADAGR
ncbi:N-acetylmuramoyl-L-alanine amidase, major autolysin [Serinicoccus hydrothermalis]|uniref:N-acetylmuramoyl-L-alanine amidase, major autolysin n=1 Tax=Serinicoccus hydrothermalis TaxID=1758689 RepID=A0A1B1NCG1_9MICO|nr:peptidoglycan-binding protein [Serinicoccus hydrothermalis]ANS79118.1 N-acetylmuramoyl-L-alanine amidase, major autolysin [Serinicoccus hydrothermalis]